MGGGKLRKTEVAPCPDERGDQGAQSLRTLFNIIRRDPRRKDLGSADSPRFAGAGGFWVRARMGDGGSARASIGRSLVFGIRMRFLGDPQGSKRFFVVPKWNQTLSKDYVSGASQDVSH